MSERRMHFELNRPSDDGFDEPRHAHHRCEAGNKLARMRGHADDDVLEFWPFPYLSGIPTGIPTPVQSIEPCGACGRYVTAMFSWKSNLIIF